VTDFEARRDELATLRSSLERAREEALLAREAARQAERKLADFSRSAGRGNQAERARLEEAFRAAQNRAGAADRERGALRDRESGLVAAFDDFTDPRRAIQQWPDRFPILLFPLRLETRFKPGSEGQPQLWVRAYPDTCLIDTFEASLTEQEVTNAQRFWSGIWRAAGDEALERTAWRDLVAAHGSGRAGWIVRQYLPLNPGDKPARSDPAELFLIIVTSGPLPAAASAYWAAVWRADGDPDLEAAAYQVLEAAVGAVPAQVIAEQDRPVNFADGPPAGTARDDVQVKVVVLQLTPVDQMATRRTSWSRPARVELLPERLVLIGFTGTSPSLTALGQTIPPTLLVSPDPNAPPESLLKPIDDTLQIPDEIAWMFEFERALAVGMAFRVDLSPEQAQAGFDRLIVLGVRLGDSPTQAAERLEGLLEHHLYSRSGLEILPQGTPTNNTDKAGSGYSFRDDPDASFTPFYQQAPEYSLEPDSLLRSDGEWLAQLVGIRHDLVQRVPRAGGHDQSEARAMQISLWSGTLGYAMQTLLAPVFSDGDVGDTRGFFTRYVTGRGPLPVLQIADQPYGILPATAFSRINWFDADGRRPYAGRLYAILKQMDQDWAALLGLVSYIGKPGGDPHQTLLDVLGLDSGSLEYYPLQADSVAHKFYELSLLDVQLAQAFLALFPAATPLDLLRRFGYAGAQVPEVLNHVFRARQTPLDGPLIDDRPLSESDRIRAYAGPDNYIQWLVDAAKTGVSALQEEKGFDNDTKPTALLYLMLRHALQLAFHETGIRRKAAVGEVAGVMTQLQEPSFVHVSAEQTASESRYSILFRPDPQVTGSADLLLGDYIAANVTTVDPNLGEQIAALERLSLLPTARLERVFAEHIDCCGYRLDAWKTGLLTQELERLSQTRSEQAPAGLFLGAFGWVESLRPDRGKVLTPVELPGDLAGPVNRRDQAPLLRDAGNGGLIHAPSLNLATTAAVLRNGYIANDGRLAVNLSSRRVRLALGVLEGMRGGQSLGALLGYQFERYLHDNGPLTVRALVYPLRRAFPLVANQIASTQTQDGDAREAIAAMNVVDGRKLIEQAEGAQNFVYPFGVTTLPTGDPAQAGALTAALAYIRDINDAVADLGLAEGVHQAVLGNYDRAAGTLDAFAKGNYPPEPEVIRTPRTGIGLTHRIALHLAENPPPPALPTPLGAGEPSVEAWLADHLPPAADVGCNVSYTDRGAGIEATPFITQAQLGLGPSDLLYRGEVRGEGALVDLDERILTYLHATFAPRYDREIRIGHTEHVEGKITWFELQAQLRSLRSMLVASRPLRPGDLMLSGEATSDVQANVSLPKGRIRSLRDDLSALIPSLATLATAIGSTAVPVDAALAQFVTTIGRFAAYRLPGTGVGFAFEWRAGAYGALTGKITNRVKIWDERLARYQLAIDAYDALPSVVPEDTRVPALRAAEILISTRLDPPTPLTSAAYRLALDGKRSAFVARRNALQALVDIPRATLAALVADTEAVLPLTAMDPDPFDLSDDDVEITRFRARLADAVARLQKETTSRLQSVDDLLAQHDGAAAEDRVKLLQQAARLLLGDDFQVVPRLTLPSAPAQELGNAWQYSSSGGLTKYVRETIGRDFPVDDWLHGVARVREKMHDVENAALLGEALRPDHPLELIPLQLPYQANEPWFALDLPPNHDVQGERLLYTAHMAEPFDAAQPICGLLVDEWTEVIPGPSETTGIAFNYDRPNCEPPQSWLLALPAVRNGTWSWDELVGAVTETLDAAQRRAIEPVHVDATAYGSFLPATTSAYTYPEISISNNLLRNVRIYAGLITE